MWLYNNSEKKWEDKDFWQLNPPDVPDMPDVPDGCQTDGLFLISGKTREMNFVKSNNCRSWILD